MPLQQINWLLKNHLGGPSGGIPSQSSALFWLDGTLDGAEFVDKSGNGRNFTITNKDFTASYFPYKSAATISAPAADAVLIAADVNNFLYDSGETPNEIPVVSFFQNIDYEDIGFNRHIAQVVDGNGVETTEPHVKDIVWYAAALTGDDLTTANSYYGVPTEQTSTVKWVAKDGNDTTGDGSKALPWLTLQHAQTNATAGDLIYTKTGEYTEASYLTATKSISGLGRVKFNGGGADYSILVNTASTTFKNLIIEGDAASTTGFFINGAATGVILESIYEQNHGRYFVRGTASGLTVKYCVGTSDTSTSVVRDQAGGVLVDTCMFAGDTNQCVKNLSGAAGDVVIKNCKAIGVITTFYTQDVAATSVQIIGNEFESNVKNCYTTAGFAGAVEISYNTGTLATKFVLAPAGGDIVVKNNDITMGGAPGSILITERNCEVYDNIFKVTTTGAPLLITAASGSYTIDVHGNYLENASTGGMFNVGSEADLTPNTLSGSVYNNHCVGSFKIDSTTNNTHGIFVWLNGNVDVYNNFIEGCALSVVIKGNGTDYSAGMVFANVCDGRIVVKGVINSNVIGNTINVTEDIGGAGSVYGINLLAEAAFDSTGTIIKNNITIVDVVGALITCIQANDANQTFTTDYNTYYNVNNDWFRIATTDYTFAEWQGIGNDANGNDLTFGELATLFTDAANDDFSLPVGSDAIGAGETLPSPYDIGLDASTDWGDVSTLPVVVTKQQNVPADVGAYVS